MSKFKTVKVLKNLVIGVIPPALLEVLPITESPTYKVVSVGVGVALLGFLEWYYNGLK